MNDHANYSAELVRYEPGDNWGRPGELNVLLDGHEIVLSVKTLELPDLGNEPNVSCVPEGDYTLTARREGGFAALYKKKFGHQFSLWVRGVPDRKFILVHIGNRVDPHAPPKGKPHSQGCVLVGMKHGKVSTKDGPWWAVWNSAKAYRQLYQTLLFPLAPQDASIPFTIRNAYEEADAALTEDRSDI